MRGNAIIYALIPMVLGLSFSTLTWADEAYLVWSTFLGGQYHESGQDIKVDILGDVYLTGLTGSGNFPVTAGVYDGEYGGSGDVFVAKLSTTGNTLVYATFLGGSDIDEGHGIALDRSGNVYVTGYTASADFPTTIGAFDTTYGGENDVFVAKLNAMGSALDYATFLGGGDYEIGKAIIVDDAGRAYVTGCTRSVDFPITAGAFDETLNQFRDAFVVKLHPMGNALDYATYLGGNGYPECGTSIALDGDGNAYVTGYTDSPDFPTTIGAFDTTHNGESDVFVVKLNSTGTDLDYGTYLGGSERDHSFLGDPDIVVDIFGNAYMTGSTGSPDFPTTLMAFDRSHNGEDDVFVAKLNAAGNTLAYSTFLGGSGADGGGAIVVDRHGNAFVTGCTKSWDFPTTTGAFDTTYNDLGDLSDAFMGIVDRLGISLLYATFLGGNATDEGLGISLDGSGKAVLTGMTFSSNFPTTPGAFDGTFDGSAFHGDAFVSKFVMISTSIAQQTDSIALPQAYRLDQNFPNPFNANTEIRYRIAKAGHVTLTIYNILGQNVCSLVDADHSSGEHIASWDGRDDAGEQVANGIYLCRLRAANFAKTIKIAFFK